MPTAAYVYGLDLTSQNRSGTVHYYGYDGLGSVRYLTKASDGTDSDTYVYDAFGIQIASTGSTINQFRFAGEYLDPDLGLYHLRARDYHPDLGRFWTMDSFEGFPSDPLSLHKYLYAHADPVNNRDPSGHVTTTMDSCLAHR
jgi:RHS repeat-associated protein